MSTIRCLRTYRLPDRSSLIWLELETSDGLVGLGETFRGAASVETCLHEELAPWLLGGAARPSVPVYNTCAGYSFNTTGKRRDIGSDDESQGPYDDQVAFMRDAG